MSLRSSSRLALVVVVLTLGAVGPRAQQQTTANQAPTVLPIVIDGRVPQASPIAGQAGVQSYVVVRVTTDGEEVSAVEVAQDPTVIVRDNDVEIIAKRPVSCR
jgi:hypothetical protein